MNNKGLAEIVQVLFITALSIVAIATVSSYIIGLSDNVGSKLSPAVDCLTIKSDIIRACINSKGETKLLVNSVEQNTDIKIGLNNEIFECSTDSEKCNTCILKEGSKEIFLSPSNLANVGDKINYQINGCSVQEKVVRACVEP